MSEQTIHPEISHLINQIKVGDCIESLRQMPDESVDMVFADPPYFLQLQGELDRPDNTRVDGVHDEWDQFDSRQAYKDFCLAWLKECRRVLKENGTMWIIGSHHNYGTVTSLMQDIDFWILNDVHWIKSNPMPNFKGTRLCNATESLTWAAKTDKSRYTFPYKALKAGNEDKQLRNDWYIPICTGAERIKGPNGEKLHPTQKPEQLLDNVIRVSTHPGDVILDPFFGSGTTGAVAKRLHRNFIGFEGDEFYASGARQRIDEVELDCLETTLYRGHEPRKQPRVPFVNLLQQELVFVSQELVSKTGTAKATIDAYGNLRAIVNGEEVIGSIHEVAKLCENSPKNINGWTYWHVINPDGSQERVLIDELRKQSRRLTAAAEQAADGGEAAPVVWRGAHPA